MASASADDELLLILLRNLHNASETLGPSHESVRSIRETVREHLRDMQSRGVVTDLTQVRELQQLRPTPKPQGTETTGVSFENLVFRPKPTGP